MQSLLILVMLELAAPEAAAAPRNAAAPASSLPAAGDAGKVTEEADDAAEAVLVLKSGQSMVVRSYAVDGRLLRIVGRAGEPLLLKADLADLDRSRTATAAHRRELAEQTRAEEETAAAAAEEKRLKEDRNAAQIAQSTGRGSLNVAPEKYAEAPPSSASPTGGKGAASDVPAHARRRAEQLRARYNALVREHNELVEQYRSPMAAQVQILTQIDALRAQIDQVTDELRELQARHAGK